MTATSQAASRAGLGEALVMPPGAFRLTLAAAVVVSHASRFDIGRLAVLLFFLLSGYWTARVWTEKFGGTALGRFYAARYLRIIPLYLCFMALACLLKGVWPNPVNFTLLGVASQGRDPTGVSWSLDVELQFYILLPLVVAMLTRMKSWLFLALSLAIAVAGLWLGKTFGVVTALKYLPAFVLGSMIYTTKWKPSTTTANVSLAGFLAMTLVTALTPFLDKKVPDPFDQDIWDFLWMLPLVPYVAASLSRRSTKLDRHYGNLSYPLYLAHYSILMFIYGRLGENIPAKGVGVAAACAAALLAYVVIDRPVDAWRVRVTEGER